MKNANLVSRAGWSIALAGVFAFAACGRNEAAKIQTVPPSPAAIAGATAPVSYSYEVIRSWPHDRAAFTQGLVFRNGALLESTGLNGRSSVREVELATGRVLKHVALPQQYFGEGLAVLDGRVFQLTWQNQRGFVYDVDTFRKEREFTYEGEGWGLTTDGKSLILSDGTHRLRFLDPVSFQVQRVVEVLIDGKPVNHLNELEWIDGEVFANVWQTDRVVRIDPATGQVRGVVDFSGLLGQAERAAGADVFNGIAYDPASDRLFVTGKFWPKIFEVRLKIRP